jgi:stage V sporulation protein R
MKGYTVEDLAAWDQRIQEWIARFHLQCYPQEFELIDYEEMLNIQAYSGMPAYYPHWSFGKAYERTRTQYQHGVTGLPYEMVINCSPCLAYLMRDNGLALQILTMAHVYGHNDFFRSNKMFQHTEPENVFSRFKTNAGFVRRLQADPSIGPLRVEEILDAAHALMFNCRRYPGVRRLRREEQQERLLERSRPPEDEFAGIHPREEVRPPDLDRVPLEPEEDLLLFIRDHAPGLKEWERHMLTIVHETASYFVPQIETKIMNEGWASLIHYLVLSRLDLPPELAIDFIRLHNGVVRPHVGGINPYHLGFRIYLAVYERAAGPRSDEHDWGKGIDPDSDAWQRLLIARESARDSSFLRQYLDEELIRDLGLFEHQRKVEGQRKLRVVSEVADEEGWRKIRDTLARQVGMGAIPVIKVVEMSPKKGMLLVLNHEHDGRDLDLGYAEKTLQYVQSLWRHPVELHTKVQDKPLALRCESDGVVKRSDQS